MGVWYWEVDNLPVSMRPAYGLVDEVWCSTEYMRSALARWTEGRVRKHPLIIDVPSAPLMLSINSSRLCCRPQAMLNTRPTAAALSAAKRLPRRLAEMRAYLIFTETAIWIFFGFLVTFQNNDY